MFVSIENNKYQIIIASIIGFLVYYFTKKEDISIGIVITLSFILRKIIKIDEKIKKYIK